MRLKKLILIINIVFAASSLIAQNDPQPVANFQVDNLCFGSISNFTNTSSSLLNPVYKWIIYQQGNSVPIYTASTTNISFQFPVKTTYTITLRVTNYKTVFDFHTDTVTRKLIIENFPVANFDFENCQAKFANLSCCTNSYLWDFGDGTPTSTLTSPVHTYTTFTTYTVTLIANNGTQSDTMAKEVYPYANVLTGNFNIVYVGDSVKFKVVLPNLDDSLRAAFWDWEWNLGDGTALDLLGQSGWNVSHYYQRHERDSIYNVTLSVKDLCFTAENTRRVLIKGIGKNVTSTYVYPSPVVYGYLNIESNEKDKLQEIKIIDCLGKRLDNLTVWDKPYGYYLWIGNIANGVYTVQLIFSDRIENHKIIKE